MRVYGIRTLPKGTFYPYTRKVRYQYYLRINIHTRTQSYNMQFNDFDCNHVNTFLIKNSH